MLREIEQNMLTYFFLLSLKLTQLSKPTTTKTEVEVINTSIMKTLHCCPTAAVGWVLYQTYRYLKLMANINKSW